MAVDTREQQALLQAYNDTPNHEIRNQAALAYRKLIFHALKYVTAKPVYGIREDLIQVGWLKLLQLIESYKPDKGVRFTSYAIPSLVREMNRHIQGYLSPFDLHCEALSADYYLMLIEDMFIATHGRRHVDDCELAHFVGCRSESIERVRRECFAPPLESLYEAEMSDEPLADRIPGSDNLDPAVALFLEGSSLTTVEFGRALETLPPDDQMLVVLYSMHYSFTELERCFGLTRQGVYARFKASIRRLRVRLELPVDAPIPSPTPPNGRKCGNHVNGSGVHRFIAAAKRLQDEQLTSNGHCNI